MVKNLKLNFKGNELKGTAHIPSGEGKFKTVIMFHGFEASKIGEESKLFKLADKLIEKNIASIRFDFLGHGDSDGNILEITAKSEVEQGKEIVNFVRTLDFVEINNVSLLGFEFGSVIASIVAGEMKEEVEELYVLNSAEELVDEVQNKKLIFGVPIYKFYKNKNIKINNFVFNLEFVKDLEIFPYYEKARVFNKNIKILENSNLLIGFN